MPDAPSDRRNARFKAMKSKVFPESQQKRLTERTFLAILISRRRYDDRKTLLFGYEVANLLEIKDNYPKYVVTMDELATGNVSGIKIMHLADFLLSADY